MKHKQMVEVFIEMDRGYCVFFPIPRGTESDTRSGSMEIPQELFDRHAAALQEYAAVSEQLEQLFRIQQGMNPYQNTPIPEHTILK